METGGAAVDECFWVDVPQDQKIQSRFLKNMLGGLSRPFWSKNIVQKLSRLEGKRPSDLLYLEEGGGR